MGYNAVFCCFLLFLSQKNDQPLACKLMNQMRRFVSAEAVGTRLDRFRHCFISAGRTEAPFILKSFLFKGPWTFWIPENLPCLLYASEWSAGRTAATDETVVLLLLPEAVRKFALLALLLLPERSQEDIKLPPYIKDGLAHARIRVFLFFLSEIGVFKKAVYYLQAPCRALTW